MGFLPDNLFLFQISSPNCFLTRLIDLLIHGSGVVVICLAEVFLQIYFHCFIHFEDAELYIIWKEKIF